MAGLDWKRSHVLVLGARGMLGTELAARLGERTGPAGGQVTAWDLAELDICDSAAVHDALVALRPGVVVNAAAYTDVDGCEDDEDAARAVNGVAPGHLAGVCRAIGAFFVHFSTDFVFDGSGRAFYGEEAAAAPLNAYGRTKWAGEEAVRAAGCEHLIVRTSWLFGPGGRNFVEAILRRAEAGERLRVVDDQVGRPTYTADLVEAVMALLDAGARGTVHFANRGACSWWEFAREIVAAAGVGSEVAAITSDELQRAARRPAYSALDTSRYERLTSLEPAHWKDALARYLAARRQGRAVKGTVQ